MVLGRPLFLLSARCCEFRSFPSDIAGHGLCGEFSHGDPETCSLLSQNDPVCYFAFQEDEAFWESELYVSECYLADRFQFQADLLEEIQVLEEPAETREVSEALVHWGGGGGFL